MKKLAIFFLSLMLFGMFANLGLVHAAQAETTPTNLITNPSAETASTSGSDPAGWSHSSWGTNIPAYSVKATGQDGSKSLYVKISKYTDGDAKWYFDPISVNPGASYVFSDYYKASTDTDIVADYIDASGNDSYYWLGSASSSTAWKQVGFNFIVPAGAVKMTVLHVLAQVGTLQTDSFSIHTPIQATITNGVPNSSLEQVSDLNSAQPLGWSNGSWGDNTTTFAYVANGYDGTHSVKATITNYTDGDAKWYFDPVTVTPGMRYVFADYYKANVATAMVAQVENTDGSTSYYDMGTVAKSTAWKRAALAFTAPANAKTVTILHLISAVGYLQIDQASWLPDTQVIVANGVPNNSLEQTSLADTTTPLGWITGNYGTNTAKFSYVTTAHTGTHAVKTQITKYTDGDAKWYYAEQPVTAGTSYTFSDWYTSTETSQVVMQLTMTDGSTQYLHLPIANAATNWTQYSTKIAIPAGAKSATVLHLIAGVGSLVTDDYSLVPAQTIGFNRALVSLTFDDGWSSIYSNGIPLLDAHGFKSTQYIITGDLNTPDYMTDAMVASMYADGQEIASHTVTHPDLTTLTGAQLVKELHDSQAYLVNHGWGNASAFATPYGAYNATVIAGIKTYYTSHRSTDVGYNSRDSFDAYNLKVQDISLTTTDAQINGWLAQAATDHTWLILVFHQIDNSGEQFSSTPAQLSSFLDDVTASHIQVSTIGQAMGEVTPQL